jgi:hypothetical protein
VKIRWINAWGCLCHLRLKRERFGILTFHVKY